jgi:hypothetical protein
MKKLLSRELPLRVFGTPPPMHLLIYAQVCDQSPSDLRIDRMLAAQSDAVILD